MTNLADIIDHLRYMQSDLQPSDEARIARLQARKAEIKREWEALEEAGQLRYFNTSCLKPWPNSLVHEAAGIDAQLMRLGVPFE
jgi:DNA-binding transcriptional MerR regulator